MPGPRPRRVTITRYVDAAGNRVTKGTPGARAVRCESETWYATLTLDGVRRTVSLGTTDEGAAWVELRRIQREGLVKAPRPKAATVVQHAEDWRDSLLAGGADRRWAIRVHSGVCKLATLAGWGKLADVTRDSASAALAKLLAPPLSHSPQTRNHYLAHLRQFVRWCVETERLSRDPLSGLKPMRIEHDVRRKRRVPTTDEIAALFAYLEGSAPTVRGMTGRCRALGYKVAMGCGLRRCEMRSLTPESFDLAAGTVAVHAAYDKAGRAVVQPLPSWLVAELQEWFAGGGGCWTGFPADNANRVFRADLKTAGIPYITLDRDNKTPCYLDLHSLRHWYVTEIASQPGMDPKTGMTLTRHSSPALFLKTYAKVKDEKTRAAADAIPKPGA